MSSYISLLLGSIFCLIFLSPFLLIIFYIFNRLRKASIANKYFKEGEAKIKAEVYEIFEGSNRGRFYIVKAKYIDGEGKEFKYKSKRSRIKPNISIGDKVEVIAAKNNNSAYRRFKV